MNGNQQSVLDDGSLRDILRAGGLKKAVYAALDGLQIE
jgi:hypothetical protein